MKQTQDMLARHHKDGEAFAQMLKDSFAGRFNEEFWTHWDKSMGPVLTASPVILDLGSGPGMFLNALAEHYPGVRAIGIEVAAYMLDAAVELADNCEIITADLHDPHLPLESGSVDAAIATVVLHEMHQPVRAMQEVCRCLKPGGRFYVLDWVRAPLVKYLENASIDVFDSDTPAAALENLFVHFIEHNRFSMDDLVFLLEHTGFRILEKTLLKEGRQARLVAEKV